MDNLEDDPRTNISWLLSLFDSSPVALIVVNTQGEILMANTRATELFGYEPGKLNGQPLTYIIPESFRYQHSLQIDSYFAKPRNRLMGVGLELLALRADGTEIPVEIGLSTVKTEMETFALASIVGIAKRKELAEQISEARLERDLAVESSRIRSEHLSRVSHELRTPLSTIIGFTDLLQMGESREDHSRFLKEIESASDHLLKLIDTILEISQGESGKLDLTLEPVPLVGLVSNALYLFEPAIAENNIVISVDIEPLLAVIADRARLQQVLNNLISNAIKFNRKRGKIAISATPLNGDIVQITVSDTGIGIATQNAHKLFQPLERLGANQLGVKGTGLGLALCRQLIEAMVGTIELEPRPGGATFRVTLQRSITKDGQVGRTVTSDTSPDIDNPFKILYVDGTPDNFRLLEAVTARIPRCRLMVTMQGSMALQFAREHTPDLILLDSHLLDINEADFLNELRSDEATRNTPVVIMSSDATSAQRKRIAAKGADSYLVKPIRIPALIELIEKYAHSADTRLRSKLSEQAIKDHLTGLYNRRYMDEVMDREVGRALRSNELLSIITIDVDNLKRVNDTLGHPAGDQLLRSIAQVFRDKIRKEDTACRVGGDEFMLIFPNTSQDAASKSGRKLLDTVIDLDMGSSYPGTVTISLGIATYPESGHTVKEVIDAADAALYTAKRAGKNQLALAPKI